MLQSKEEMEVRRELCNSRFLPINRKLIKKLGPLEAVFVQFLYDKYSYYLDHDMLVNGYFFVTRQIVESELGIKRWAYDSLVEKLRTKRIISIKIQKFPSKKFYRINFKTLRKYVKFP